MNFLVRASDGCFHRHRLSAGKKYIVRFCLCASVAKKVFKSFLLPPTTAGQDGGDFAASLTDRPF